MTVVLSRELYNKFVVFVDQFNLDKNASITVYNEGDGITACILYYDGKQYQSEVKHISKSNEQ